MVRSVTIRVDPYEFAALIWEDPRLTDALALDLLAWLIAVDQSICGRADDE